MFALTRIMRLPQAVSAVLLFALAVLFFLPGTMIQPVHASTVTIHLVAHYVSGWNGTTNPNPTITVQQGDTVTIVWSNGDSGSVPHQFLLDVDKDNLDTSDCSPTADPCTGMTTTGGSVTFTASTAGSFTYYCTVHPTSMVGSFIVESPGLPDFSIGTSLSTLSITQGSTSTVTVTLTSLSRFKGTLALTGSVSQPGPTVTFSPASVTLSSGGTVTSNMTLSAVGGTYSPVATGSYTVTITVTNGTLTHSTPVNVNVVSVSSPASGLPLTILVGAVIVIAAVAGLTIYLVRRTGRKPQPK